MELISSVHWVANQESTGALLDPDAAIEHVHAWNDRKRRLFKADHIVKAWQRLNQQKWL